MDGKHCGEQILAARRRAGLSQEGLAGLIGVSPQAVRKWECGKTYPRREKWPLLEQKMNLSPGWFFALQAEGKADVLRQNVAQTSVNHGTVVNGGGSVNVNGVNNGTVKACGGPPCPKTEKPMGDIARELCEMIATQLEGKNMDIQIAVRAQVKAALNAALEQAKMVR